MKRLLWLYPRRWRRRYGEEMEALLEEMRPSLATALDLLRGGLDAQLHRDRPRWLRWRLAVGAVAALGLTAVVCVVDWLMVNRWLPVALEQAAVIAAGWLFLTIYFRRRRRRHRRRGQDPGEGSPVPAEPLPDAPPALAASRGSGRRSDPE